MRGGGTATRGAVAVRVLQLVAVVAVVVLIAWRLDLRGLVEAFRVDSWPFLALALLANLASACLKGVAWKGVVDGLPGMARPSRLRELLGPLFVGLMVNTILAARIGEVARAVLAGRRLRRNGSDVSSSALLGAAVVESIAAMFAWVLFAVAIGLLLPLPSYAWIVLVVVGVGCLAVVVGAVTGRGRGSRRLARARRLVPGRAVGVLSRIWAAMREGQRGLREPRRLGAVAGGSMGGVLAQWLGIVAVLHAFGLGRVGWGGAALLLVSVTIAQAFPVLPGNLVTYQAAAILPLVTSYDVATSSALAFSVVLQASQAVVGVGVGFLCLVGEGMTLRSLRMRVALDRSSGPERA